MKNRMEDLLRLKEKNEKRKLEMAGLQGKLESLEEEIKQYGDADKVLAEKNKELSEKMDLFEKGMLEMRRICNDM